ncbi:hypothetical protein SMICM17S_05715 [Streptomyces microflavus]
MIHPGFSEPRTKEEWWAYLAALAHVPGRPVLPTWSAYQAISEAERAAFNEARDDYHSAFVTLRTPPMDRIHQQITKKIKLSRFRSATSANPSQFRCPGDKRPSKAGESSRGVGTTRAGRDGPPVRRGAAGTLAGEGAGRAMPRSTAIRAPVAPWARMPALLPTARGERQDSATHSVLW